MISTLSRVPEVEVISRTSVMHYEKEPKPIKEVSKELDVGTILEGSVRKAGNKLRIAIKMIDPSREHPIWADSYDRELQDVFGIQSEVATRVAQALLVEHYDISATPRKNPTANPEAYALYLKGRYFWNKRGRENLEIAVGYFQQSVALDPRFASGHLGLADCFNVLSVNQIDAKANREKSKVSIAKAMELDPGLVEANATLGSILLNDYKLRDAERELKKSLILNPNYAHAHLWYYHILWAELRWDEALEHIQRAVALDPLSPNTLVNLAHYYYTRGDNQTAIEICTRSVGLDPGFAYTHDLAGRVYGKMKLFKDAKREYDTFVELKRATYPLIDKAAETWLAYLKGDTETVRKLLPIVEENQEAADLDALKIASFHFFLDDLDGGFDRLEYGYSRKEYALVHIQNFVDIPEKVRVHQRYLNLLKKFGLN